MNILIFFIYLLKLTHSTALHFPNPLQRFVYDPISETVVLASVNRIYSLKVSDLTLISEIDTSPSPHDQHCPIANRTISSKHLFYFPSTVFLNPSGNETFNQLLLLSNDSILICSSSNRGGSCQQRALVDLRLLRNSSQRLVASSPFSPSVGFISQTNQLLYLSTTYDPVCDPFYEIPTISGRQLFNESFLSTLHFNAGQSALQQSTYTLRLLNLRLIKEFFLHYLYAFEYKHFAYFLTIQQADLLHKQRLQTKVVRFCQTLKQPMMKSYVEIPLTCGRHYHYLIAAKFSSVKQRLYGLFRNTTSANATGNAHAVCVYQMDAVQEAFFQTIKRCLVDGRGQRGLGFLSPDTPCVASKVSDCPVRTKIHQTMVF